MFEDSLMESIGQIHTRSRRYAAGSLVFQATLVGVLALLPYLYPAALPRQSLSVLLTAPPPPPAPPPLPQHVAVQDVRPVQIDEAFTAPRVLPGHVQLIRDAAPPGIADAGIADAESMGSGQSGPLNGLFGSGAPTPAMPHVLAPKPQGSVRLSAGVAAGRLLAPIRPVYPQIAIAARAQGTVTLAATISKDGIIENLRVVSGPPLLRQAAVDAVSKARYAPYRLNDEPVEVETTINVVFTLGN
jgi:protein TonB